MNPGGEVADLRRLHGGRHSLPPDMVAFNQRERLLAAIAETVAEHGYNKATIAQITDAASVSRRTFYENFASKEECFLAAYRAVDGYLFPLLDAAAEAEADWSDKVAAVLTKLIRFLAEHPQLARLYLVESAVVGEGMISERDQSAERLIALLAAGRPERAGDRQLPDGTEEALIGGVMTLLTRRVGAGEAERLDSFAPAAIEFALAPYLGFEEAREVAARQR